MNIKLCPQRRDDALSIKKNGDVLNVNGQDFDFSFMSDGDTLPASAISSDWFCGEVHKSAGEITVTLLFPNPANASLAQRFPEHLVDVPDGNAVLPQPDQDPES